jgi:hypothetical protein
MKPYAGVNYIPPVRDYEFGYWPGLYMDEIELRED